MSFVTTTSSQNQVSTDFLSQEIQNILAMVHWIRKENQCVRVSCIVLQYIERISIDEYNKTYYHPSERNTNPFNTILKLMDRFALKLGCFFYLGYSLCK